MYKSFIKQLISYFLVIFIPIIALNTCYQNYSIGLYKKEIINKNINNLTKFESYFDNNVNLLQKLTHHLIQAPCFSNKYIANNPTAFYDITKELITIKAIVPMLDDIYYYNKATPSTLYSSYGTYNVNTFPNINPLFLNESLSFKDTMDTINTPIFKGPEYNLLSSSKPCIEYIIPIHNTLGYFIFRMDITSFKDLFVDIYTDNRPIDTYIFSGTDNLYTTASEDFPLPLEDFSLPDSSHVNTILKDGFYISGVISPITQLTYLNVINENILLHNVRELSNTFIFLNIFILSIGFILIFLLTHNYYKPIKRLIYSLRSSSFNFGCDIENLDQATLSINLLDRHHKRLNYERNLLKLLSGTYTTIEHFNTDMTCEDIKIDYSHFKIMTLTSLTGHTLTDLDLTYINQYVLTTSTQIQSYQVGCDHTNLLIWLIFYDSGVESVVNECIYNLYNTLTTNLSTPFKCCISNTYTNLSAMPTALMDCSNLSSKDSSERNCILFYEAHYQQSLNKSYPGKDLSSLQDAIINKDIEKIEHFVSNLIDCVRYAKDNQHLLLTLTYMVTYTFENAAKSLNIISLNALDSFKHSDYILSTENFIVYINNLKTEMINFIKLNQKTDASSSIQSIIEYINNHYCDYNLSVSYLADYFDLSISNFSHQFKSATGINVSTYINSLRIQQAKHLLSTTSLTISDIAVSIGYTQPSSFIRRFKQFTSTTPGEFRMQTQQVD